MLRRVKNVKVGKEYETLFLTLDRPSIHAYIPGHGGTHRYQQGFYALARIVRTRCAVWRLFFNSQFIQ